MVLIPGGTFPMGSPAGEADRVEGEGPQHQVQLSPYYLCTAETTIELFLVYYPETGTAKKEFVESRRPRRPRPRTPRASTRSPARPPSTAT